MVPNVDKNNSAHLRILLADDVWATINSIGLMLRLMPDMEVVATARNGRQAIEMTREHEPDVALIDINMPEVDGLTAMETMRRYRPELLCIIMSVEGDDVVIGEAKSRGAFDFLIKPFTTEELLDVLERAGRTVLNQRPVDGETAELRRKVTAPLRTGQTSQLRSKREEDLKRLATNYLKTRRTDDEVMRVLEELADNPSCEPHWLKSLAMIYVIRKEWEKLGLLADRLKRLVV